MVQGTSKDVPGLLEDAKLVLEYLAEVSSDPVSEDLSVNPTVVADLGVMAENARAELEGTIHHHLMYLHCLTWK